MLDDISTTSGTLPVSGYIRQVVPYIVLLKKIKIVGFGIELQRFLGRHIGKNLVFRGGRHRNPAVFDASLYACLAKWPDMA
jgi:hypothetical protein